METEDQGPPKTAIELADRIVEVCRDLHDSVTHGNLISRLGDCMRGNYEYHQDNTNVTFFVGISEMACSALRILQRERPHRVHLRGVHVLCHMTDGSPLPTKMPWLKGRPPKGGFKKTRFASVGFDPVTERKPCSCPPPECERDGQWLS